MLHDQVRKTTRSKKISRHPTSARAGSRVAVKSRLNSRRGRSDGGSSLSIVPGHRWLVIALLVTILITTSWIGLKQILSYAITSSQPTLTLFLNTSPGGGGWLLAERPRQVPVVASLPPQIFLDSGLSRAALNVSGAAAQLTPPFTEYYRQLVSQQFGLPISAIVSYQAEQTTEESASETPDISALVTNLRGQWIVDLKGGSINYGSGQRWLAVNAAKSLATSDRLSDVVTSFARLNMTAITSAENCPVAVLNNSGMGGLASQVGSVIEQNGGRVVRIANALSFGEAGALSAEGEGTQGALLLLSPEADQQCSDTLRTINSLFASQQQPSKTLPAHYRAALVLVLNKSALLPEVATEAAQYPRQ